MYVVLFSSCKGVVWVCFCIYLFFMVYNFFFVCVGCLIYLCLGRNCNVNYWIC